MWSLPDIVAMNKRAARAKEREEEAKNPKPKRGTCRICGCTETTPCMTPGGPCAWAWADKTQTLCSNPNCIRKAAGLDKAKTKKKGKAK